MATIAQLDVIYSANTRGLTAGLRDAARQSARATRTMSRHAGRLTRSFRGTMNQVVNLRSAVAVLAGGAGIGLLVRNQLKAVDSTAKFARMIGETTEEVSGLQHAAEVTAGVTTRQFNMALQRMTRRLAEAANGTGEAKDAIASLGLSAERLQQLGPAEAFRTIADAMQDVENPAQRVRIAFKLFDSEGAKLVNTLSAGREQIVALQREADRIGRTFSELDAEQIEKANDAITRMQGALGGASRILAIDLAPWITAAANQVVELANSSIDFGEVFATTGRGVVEVTAAMADGVRGLHVIWKGLQVVATGVLGTIATAVEAVVVMFAKTLDRINGYVNEAIRAFNRIPGVSIPLFQSVESSAFVQSVRDGANTAREVIGAVRSDLNDLMLEPLPSQAIDEFIANASERLAKLGAANPSAGGAPVPGGAGGGEGGGAGDGDANEGPFANLSENLASALVTGAQEGRAGVLDEFSKLLQDMAASFLQSQVVSLLKNLGSNLGGGAAGGGAGGVFGTIASAFAGFFADGGMIPRGQFGVVGEDGPELVGGPTRVTPMGGGAPSVTNNITLQGPARQEDAMMVEAAVRRGNARLIDDLTRRGRI
jgi:hypothetical protein